jgi:hypothetical protein
VGQVLIISVYYTDSKKGVIALIAFIYSYCYDGPMTTCSPTISENRKGEHENVRFQKQIIGLYYSYIMEEA